MNELSKIIKAEIRSSGKITFERFMEQALYNESYGYYSSGKVSIGREGDFYTSPYVHRAFGDVITNFILKSLSITNAPAPTIVEIGAGYGILAGDILDSLQKKSPSIYNNLKYKYIENSASLLNQAQHSLKDHSDKIEYKESLSELGDQEIQGIIISNELFDSIPFHRMTVDNTIIKESYVTLENDNFKEVTGDPSTPELENYLSKYDLKLNEGQQFEINLGAVKAIEEINRVLNKGLVLTIDYGYLAEELYSGTRMNGTYKCMKGHTINENPYDDIGEQDITAHVDFTRLISKGNELGLKELKYTTQGQFLIDWGILDIIENISQSGEESAEKKIASIKNLFLQGSMGNQFKVLIQEKNLGERLAGFYPESPFKISFDVV